MPIYQASSHLPKLGTDSRSNILLLTVQKSNHPTSDINPIIRLLIHSPDSRAPTPSLDLVFIYSIPEHWPHHQISYLFTQLSSIDPFNGPLIHMPNLPGTDPLYRVTNLSAQFFGHWPLYRVTNLSAQFSGHWPLYRVTNSSVQFLWTLTLYQVIIPSGTNPFTGSLIHLSIFRGTDSTYKFVYN